METLLEDADGVLTIVGLFAVLPIAGASKLARVSVPVASLAWVVYFGSFLVWVRIGAPNWAEAFGWTLILNVFKGLGVLPTTLVAGAINKVTNG